MPDWPGGNFSPRSIEFILTWVVYGGSCQAFKINNLVEPFASSGNGWKRLHNDN
jgi:hypothetical protein